MHCSETDRRLSAGRLMRMRSGYQLRERPLFYDRDFAPVLNTVTYREPPTGCLISAGADPVRNRRAVREGLHGAHGKRFQPVVGARAGGEAQPVRFSRSRSDSGTIATRPSACRRPRVFRTALALMPSSPASSPAVCPEAQSCCRIAVRERSGYGPASFMDYSNMPTFWLAYSMRRSF